MSETLFMEPSTKKQKRSILLQPNSFFQMPASNRVSFVTIAQVQMLDLAPQEAKLQEHEYQRCELWREATVDQDTDLL